MKKNFIIILFLLALAIFISGCMGLLTTPGEDSIAPGKGKLEIYLIDSSEKYKARNSEIYSEVNITISKIEAHIAGDDWDVLEEWVPGMEPTFDLIELKDKSILLSEEELTPGKYTQIRLFITKANVFVEMASEGSEENIEFDSDEEKDIIVESSELYKEYNLEIPSNLHTGLKLIHPFEIIENGTTELTIDFDAEKSIVKTDDGEYKLKPTIKVTSIIVTDTNENVNGNE